MTAILIGKPLPGLRARDIVRGVDLLAGRPEVDGAHISALGKNRGAVPLLYAAAFDERIRGVALEGMLVSYDAVANRRIHRQVFESIVPGALEDYDLPDLAAAMAPRPVWLVDAVDPLGAAVSRKEAPAWTRARVLERPESGNAAEFYRDLF